MKFNQILDQTPTTFSFEFFPPKTEQSEEKFRERVAQLKPLRPSFATCTYGAGGSTSKRTGEIVKYLGDELDVPTAAHVTCVGHSRDELVEMLSSYRDLGIDNIVALRGDAPKGDETFEVPPDGLQYGNEVVELIRENFGDEFGIAVGGYPEGHPETPSKLDDMDNLKRKVEAGSDCVITQLFFDNRDFYDFLDRCEIAKIDVPIIAGIMPIVSRKGIVKMAGLCGARLPAKLLRRLERAGDDDEHVAMVGIDWATQQCRDLLDEDVRGIHFYTLNRSGATIEVFRRLGAQSSEELHELTTW